MSSKKSIVYVQTAFIGDAVLAVPALLHLKEYYSDYQIIFVCRLGVGDLFRRLNLVDFVFEVEKKSKRSYREVLSQLAEFKIEKVISPHESLTTALFVQDIDADIKIGFKKFWNLFFYDLRVTKNRQLPEALRQMQLLGAEDEKLQENISHYLQSKRAYLRGENGRMSAPPLWAQMNLTAHMAKNSSDWLTLQSRLPFVWSERKKVLLFPGSVWETKKWTDYLSLAKNLTRQYEVVLMGAANEKNLCLEIQKQVPQAQVLAGQTSLHETLLIIHHADLVVCNDSSPAHLASLTNTPVLSIFGPTIIEQGFRPWSAQAYVLDRQGLFCRPCGAHGHNKCPRGTHECMKNISVAEVEKSVQSVLKI